MKIFSLLILLSLSTIAIVFALLAANSALLSDLTNFHQLDPVSNVETDYFDNYPGMVEQTQPFIPGISTSQGTAGLPIKDSSLDVAQLQPSSPSNFDAAGSSFELAEKSPPVKLGPEPPATMETVYLCCESKEEDVYICDTREQNENLVHDYCLYTVYKCPKGRLITNLAMECQDKSVERASRQSGIAIFTGAATAIMKCVISGGLQNGPFACIGLPSSSGY